MDDVLGLSIKKNELVQFPKKMVKFFLNLKTINADENKIVHLVYEDFKDHRKLEYLSLAGNEITTIDGNVFDEQLNLKYVDLRKNKLQFVGHDIKMPSIEINLLSNTCINESAQNPNQFLDLPYKLLKNCPPLIYHFEEELERRDNLLTSLKDEYPREVERISLLEFINEKIRTAFDDFSYNILKK